MRLVERRHQLPAAFIGSHGCIRSRPDDIAVLAPLVHTGTPVNLVYRTTLLAQTPDGHIWLEVQPDVYKKGANPLAELHQLVGQINWEKAYRVIEKKQGVARDISA